MGQHTEFRPLLKEFSEICDLSKFAQSSLWEIDLSGNLCFSLGTGRKEDGAGSWGKYLWAKHSAGGQAFLHLSAHIPSDRPAHLVYSPYGEVGNVSIESEGKKK